jgi:hypothetical protein
MLSPVSFALSIWNLSFEEKIETLSTWILQFAPEEQESYTKIFKNLFEPTITLSWTYGQKLDAETMHVEVTGDNLFLKMSWCEFHIISNKYKGMRVFPTYKIWKCWNDRICTLKLLQVKKDLSEDRFIVFPDQSAFLSAMNEINKEIEKTAYGRFKLKQTIQKEIQAVVHKVKCIESIRRNWAAFKIQKAYRSLQCMNCDNMFYSGIGPFCSSECVRIHFKE